MESLITDIKLDLMNNKQIATTFDVGQMYLVIITECAYRVRVEKVMKSQCLCFFVDEGDQRWIHMAELYICQSKFMKLPPQAIRLALHGLEEFDENDFAKKHLEDILVTRELIGEIFTKESDYISQEESDDLEPIIEVVLYDISTDEHISLHPVIVEKICGDIPPPELLDFQLTPVKVSYIDDNGDIYCQLQENGIHYLNKLIHKLTQPDARPQTLPVSSSSNKNIHLVFDDETHRFCRGKLVCKGNQENTIFFIDYGKTKVVPLSKIWRLESLSQALLTFPPQAIKTKLSGFKELPENLLSTLRGYFTGDTIAYVSAITLLKRFEVTFKIYFR